MADGIGFDFSEIDRLVADLGDISDAAGKNVIKAVEGTSLGVKKAWQEPLKGSRTLWALPFALTYDVEGDGTTVTSEIGFDKERNQGPLGNISEYGTPTTTGRGFGLAALEKNIPDFERGLSVALEQAEKAAGL